MGKSGQELGTFGHSDDRTFAERVAHFLRSQHPTKTAQCVSHEIGLSTGTVRKWLELGCAPNGRAVALLMRRYRGAFLWAVFPDGDDEWFAELAREEELARLEERAATIREQLTFAVGRR